MSAANPINALTAVRSIRSARHRRRPESPAELARRLDPKFVVTPTIRLLAIMTVVWALTRDPNLQIVLVSYSDELAQAHSREARQLINEHADYLGYRLSQDKTAVGRWRVDGHAGGLLATGINSGVTGFGADRLIVDDPVKDATEADSAAHRRRVITEYRSTLATRVHPGGSTLLVMTRWHERDLAGELLDSEPDVWTHTNVPAVAETGIPDALGRAPGTVMTSALGYTADHLAAARRTSGERAWYALYEGVPSAPEGGLVKREWLDDWRLPTPPLAPLNTVVGVDPSDSGSGDSCGVVAASMTREGVVAVIADVSAPMTSDQ